MAGIVVSELEYAHPGGGRCCSSTSPSRSRPASGRRSSAATGRARRTLLRILAGELDADAGTFALGGRALYMPQDVGLAGAGITVRDMLVEAAPAALRAAGSRMLAAERAVAAGGDDGAGLALATAIADWADLGGYELEQRWDAAAPRVVGAGLGEVGERRGGDPVGRRAQAAGAGRAARLGRRHPAARRARQLPRHPRPGPGSSAELQASRKTVLMISHDRTLLANVATRIVTLEGRRRGCTAARTPPTPRRASGASELLGDDLERWNDEERRLFRHMKIMKQRAALNYKNASKANAAETRWKRFVAQGPPPPPVPPQQIKVRLRGRRLGPPRRPAHRPGRRRHVRAVLRRHLLRRAHRPGGLERHGQDAPARRPGRPGPRPRAAPSPTGPAPRWDASPR